MFDSLILLFIFVLNKKKYFLSKKSKQGTGWTTDSPCSELIEVKPCLKREYYKTSRDFVKPKKK